MRKQAMPKQMIVARRRLLHLSAGGAAWAAASRYAWAETYPARPVRVVVGFAAGGVADIVARLLGQWLSERLGQAFVVENRPGAASNLAAEAVVNAPADGYTLLQVTLSNAINATLYDKLKFNLTRDLTPIAGTNRTPGVMVVNPSVPAKTVAEFIAYAKSNPGRVNNASAGPGSASHVYGELFKMMAGIELIHVHYRGSNPALTDLVGGQLQVMFDPLPSSIQYIRAGKLRPLAVTTGTRLDVLPNTPTIAEFLPGYEATTWGGLVAPKNTPTQIIQKLNKEINAALADETIKRRLNDLGAEALAGSSADFGTLIAHEAEKWGKVIRAANIKPE
jgi:tripartite-type tricarboxylate transporter receptor subunit TctC